MYFRDALRSSTCTLGANAKHKLIAIKLISHPAATEWRDSFMAQEYASPSAGSTVLANQAPHFVNDRCRDTQLKGYGVRVMPSGAKRYFIHSQHRGRRVWKTVADAATVTETEARARAQLDADRPSGRRRARRGRSRRSPVRLHQLSRASEVFARRVWKTVADAETVTETEARARARSMLTALRDGGEPDAEDPGEILFEQLAEEVFTRYGSRAPWASTGPTSAGRFSPSSGDVPSGR